MLPHAIVELIHAEIDGRLRDEQRAELSRLLMEDPEARRLREELRKLDAALARVESLPHPWACARLCWRPPPGVPDTSADA